jgi:hypothetical protein
MPCIQNLRGVLVGSMHLCCSGGEGVHRAGTRIVLRAKKEGHQVAIGPHGRLMNLDTVDVCHIVDDDLIICQPDPAQKQSLL